MKQGSGSATSSAAFAQEHHELSESLLIHPRIPKAPPAPRFPVPDSSLGLDQPEDPLPPEAVSRVRLVEPTLATSAQAAKTIKPAVALLITAVAGFLSGLGLAHLVGLI